MEHSRLLQDYVTAQLQQKNYNWGKAGKYIFGIYETILNESKQLGQKAWKNVATCVKLQNITNDSKQLKKKETNSRNQIEMQTKMSLKTKELHDNYTIT